MTTHTDRYEALQNGGETPDDVAAPLQYFADHAASRDEFVQMVAAYHDLVADRHGRQAVDVNTYLSGQFRTYDELAGQP